MIFKDVSEAKSDFSEWIDAAQQGEEVLILKAGKPVARLVAYRPASEPRRPGALKGQIRMTPDFDALPADIAEGFGADQSGETPAG